MELGPFDPSVLHGQCTHRSSLTWKGVALWELHCRRREASFDRSNALDTHIIPLLQQTSFYGVAHLGFISLDWHLIRDGKLTGKFEYPPRPAPFGTGMEILYSGMGPVWVPSQKPDSGLGRVWDFSYPLRPAPPRIRNY